MHHHFLNYRPGPGTRNFALSALSILSGYQTARLRLSSASTAKAFRDLNGECIKCLHRLVRSAHSDNNDSTLIYTSFRMNLLLTVGALTASSWTVACKLQYVSYGRTSVLAIEVTSHLAGSLLLRVDVYTRYSFLSSLLMYMQNVAPDY